MSKIALVSLKWMRKFASLHAMRVFAIINNNILDLSRVSMGRVFLRPCRPIFNSISHIVIIQRLAYDARKPFTWLLKTYIDVSTTRNRDLGPASLIICARRCSVRMNITYVTATRVSSHRMSSVKHAFFSSTVDRIFEHAHQLAYQRSI